MKNKSRFLAMALAGAMLLAMTGCGEGAASELEKMLSGGFGSDSRLSGTWTGTATNPATSKEETMVITFSGNTATCMVTSEVNGKPESSEWTLKYEVTDPKEILSMIEMGQMGGMKPPTEEDLEYFRELERNGQCELMIIDAASTSNSNLYVYADAPPYSISGKTLKFGSKTFSYTVDGKEIVQTVTGLSISWNDSNGTGGVTGTYTTFTKVSSNGSGTTNPPVDIVPDNNLVGTTWKSDENDAPMTLVFSSTDTVTVTVTGQTTFDDTFKWGIVNYDGEKILLIVDTTSYEGVKQVFASGTGVPNFTIMANGSYTLSGNTLSFLSSDQNPPGGLCFYNSEYEPLTDSYTTFTKQ